MILLREKILSDKTVLKLAVQREVWLASSVKNHSPHFSLPPQTDFSTSSRNTNAKDRRSSSSPGTGNHKKVEVQMSGRSVASAVLKMGSPQNNI